ncbi:peptidoglycan-associated lipoprotein Pal [Salinisphaera sp. Q1T1-3]|uniref:peptidoglycan-associated lipoprotein Pal n=1 Tax=Salinisphaera sp. Q1T1-3 TaxID=2321229 RepID=UPI000E742839|nr:peptidoglycan-associated lipoprotein Pal [Salinisphaera sp. Q1T1-3]RJS95407.1 peptidoglycan-associated lipoprotein Pal [Salinisphaera sp. Q1T1-3]
MDHSTRPAVRGLSIAVVLVAAAFTLTACGGGKNTRGGAPGMPAAGMNDNGQSNGMSSGRDIDVRGLEGIPAEDRHLFTDPNNPLSTRTVYFDLDSSAIPSRFSQAIQAHGQYLANHPNVHLRLEGNTDERGTREYNVALGERRADSVKQAIVLSGANAGQISTISYGEERPAELGQNAQAYSKNRRVDFIYTNN